MPNLYVRESFVNLTEGYRFGDEPWYKAYTEDRGKLFRSMQREYGRCVSRIYIDAPGRTVDGHYEPLPLGWVFQKRMEYEDARRDWPADKRFYIREVWVEVSDQPRPR